MINPRSTAIFFGSMFNGSADSLRQEDVVEELHKVIATGPVWNEKSVSVYNPGEMAKKIRDLQVKRILVAGHNVGFYKTFLTKSMLMAGLDIEDMKLINFREYGIFKKSSAPFAASVIICGFYDIDLASVYPSEESPVNDATLVIGGGIA